jgi:hypothetical protein
MKLGVPAKRLGNSFDFCPKPQRNHIIMQLPGIFQDAQKQFIAPELHSLLER